MKASSSKKAEKRDSSRLENSFKVFSLIAYPVAEPRSRSVGKKFIRVLLILGLLAWLVLKVLPSLI
mgnify:CR=1 FL=1